MALRKDTDFAIQLLVFYAKKRLEGDDYIYRREVLHETGLSTEPQVRICRLLADRGWLEVKAGSRSVGYRLSVPPEDITLKQVVELMETSTELVAAREKKEYVYNSAVWKRLQAKFDKNLESVTIGELTAYKQVLKNERDERYEKISS